MPGNQSTANMERAARAALGPDTLDPMFGRMEASIHKGLEGVQTLLTRCASTIPGTAGSVFQVTLDAKAGRWHARGLVSAVIPPEQFHERARQAFEGLGSCQVYHTQAQEGIKRAYIVELSDDYYGDASYHHTFEPTIFSQKTAARTKTAGEVRFIKDRGSDAKEWGWGTPGPSQREMSSGFEFNPRNLKPLARTLRATLAALGHAMSAYTTFSKIKSGTVSPDGALGGKGYITKIADMRRQYMNVVEALSAITDTLHDELRAPHWNPAMEQQDPRERDEVRAIVDDAEGIKEDPEGWAEEEEDEMDADNPSGKQAMQRTASSGYVVSTLREVRLKNRILAFKDLVSRVASQHLRDRGEM